MSKKLNLPPRHPDNAPGPFYVVNEYCISCDAPESEAPDLMTHAESPNYQCYFARQPETANELEQAMNAVLVSCCGAVRYAGDDPQILERLQKWNCHKQCDVVHPWKPHPLSEPSPQSPPVVSTDRAHPLWDREIDD